MSLHLRLILGTLLPTLFVLTIELRISEIKCQEYKNKYNATIGVPLTLDAEPIITLPTCLNSSGVKYNGSETFRGEFPHQALLGYLNNRTEENEFRCGGSLISEWFVLTAAHCGTPQVIRLGEHSLSDEGDGDDFEVVAFYKHPKYKLNASYHDIALAKVLREVTFFSVIRPACLWTSTNLNLSSVIVTGFGQTEFAGQGSDVLLKLQLVVMPKETCEKKFQYHHRFERGVLDEQLCVGSQYGGEDTCQGDSGGPIQILMDPKMCLYHIVGVTSLGMGCGNGKAESIYTQIASYLDWIEDTVWPGQR